MKLSNLAAELRELASDIESSELTILNMKLMGQNLAIRVGLHQLDHGVLVVNRADPRWDKLARLAEAGRLRLCSDGSVLLDNHDLSTQVLEEAKV